MVETKGFALRAAILHECQNYLGGGGGLGGSAPLPLQLESPTAATSVHLKNKMASLTVRRAISRQTNLVKKIYCSALICITRLELGLDCRKPGRTRSFFKRVDFN